MKRSKLLPLVLLIYLLGIAIWKWPGNNPGISYIQYAITVGVTLILIVILYFLLKKRENYRNRKK